MADYMQPSPPSDIKNVLTIDVEDYFQVNAFSKRITFSQWDDWESRVERNTHRLLDILEASRNGYPIRATFFILGWIAERFPNLVKAIHDRGHEVACHGYAHQLIFGQTPEEFRADVQRAKQILEDATGSPVLGYRAPTYSITRDTLWALDVLADLGFRYDSSIFPIKHDVYGLQEAPRFKFHVPASYAERAASNGLIEFPMTTIRVFEHNIPVSGGGYFRLYPYALTRSLLRAVNTMDGQGFIFYIHPWEIDPQIPKVEGVGMKSRFRTYVNLKRTEARLRLLLRDFYFSPMRDLLDPPDHG